jgi:hypothetical protein
MTVQSKPKTGTAIGPIDVETFRAFAKRHGRSDEIGPIATCLDSAAAAAKSDGPRLHLIGLTGCHKICAVACLQVYESRHPGGRQTVKLDSVIVDPGLRRRGLGGLLVASAFADVTTRPGFDVGRIYAHSVHPATVSLLRSLSFKDPPPVGAPLSSIDLQERDRDQFIAACRDKADGHLDTLKLQCALCKSRSKRRRPWCLPAGGQA